MKRISVFLVCALVLGFARFGWAQAAPTAEELRKKVQNPVGKLISLPLKSIWDNGAENGDAYILNIQPVIPMTVGEINFISRIIAPLINGDGILTGEIGSPEMAVKNNVWGLGDINYSCFLSPADPGSLIWGVGPAITFPTATETGLGSGKWSAGPTLLFMGQPKPWSLGVLFRQMWSFAGDENREEVSSFLVEPFVNYNLANGWYLISDMVGTANWRAAEGQQWTWPVGGGIGKIFKIGEQNMNTRIEAYANVVKPDGAPDWTLSWTLQFLFPK